MSSSKRRKCEHCSKKGISSRCSGCKVTFYCNTKCQTAHWQKHKKICKVIRNKNVYNKLKSVNTKEMQPATTKYKDIKQDGNDLLRKYYDSILKQLNHNEVCDVNKICSSATRIKLFLKSYEKNMNNPTAFNIRLITLVLDDYIHLITFHNDNLEDLYNSLSLVCDLQKCSAVMRNYRERFNQQQNDNICARDKALIDVMDQIHSYLVHTFDVGYRLTKSEKQIIFNSKYPNDSFIKIAKILNDKRKTFNNIVGTQNRMSHSKFVTKDNGETDEEQKRQNNSDPMYSFSYNFNYWDENDKLYVVAKYKDLKDELLNNAICKVDLYQYEEVNNKA
eukprot:166716_1